MPILHVPTWNLERKPAILLRVMQACGALFVKTQLASNFVSATLSSTQQTLMQEMVRATSVLCCAVHYIDNYDNTVQEPEQS